MKLEEACNELGEEFEMDPLTVVLAVRVELARVGWNGDEYDFDDWVVEEGDGEGVFKLDRFTHDMNGVPLRPVQTIVRREVANVVDVEVRVPKKAGVDC